MLIGDLYDSDFTLMGFNEEEIAIGVSTLDAMFQKYVSQYPNDRDRVVPLSDNQVPTFEPVKEDDSDARRQNKSLQELQPERLTGSTISLQYSCSNSVLPLEKTPEPT